jgi:beta-lactamase regulating signal transducer with metallopeptidase domain
MLFYLLQIIALQLLFIVFYKVFLRRETFFEWNRFYLISSVLLSIIIPKIHINWTSNSEIVYETLAPVIIGSKQIEQQMLVQEQNNWLKWIYIIGVIISFGIFMYKIGKLIRLSQNNKVLDNNGAKIVLVPHQQNAYTFFNYIFIDEKLYQNADIKVLEHELVHIKQRHWIDLLFIESIKIIQWFNPLIYIYQNSLKTVHEYIADKAVLQNTSLSSYFDKVLQYTFKTQKISFANEFYKSSLIKKRIKMQKKKKSRNWAKVKYAGFILLLFSVTIFVDACKQNDSEMSSSNEVKAITKEKPSAENNKSMEYPNIDNPPKYMGCTETEKEKIKECTLRKIREFINQNFDKSLAKKLGISGNVKIMTQFSIEKDGTIANVKARAKQKELAEEAKRVIKLLPKFTPGKQKGETVKVVYRLPIILAVK